MTKSVFAALDLRIAPSRVSDGLRWYSAPAVLDALALSDDSFVLLTHADKTTEDVSTALISEPAFFRLALTARTTEALALKEWLCFVVLPAIFVSNSYILHEETVMRPRVEGVSELPEWQIEDATRHILPLIRKNNFYFSGMEDVSLGLATEDEFIVARDAAVDRKRSELAALGFELP